MVKMNVVVMVPREVQRVICIQEVEAMLLLKEALVFNELFLGEVQIYILHASRC